MPWRRLQERDLMPRVLVGSSRNFQVTGKWILKTNGWFQPVVSLPLTYWGDSCQRCQNGRKWWDEPPRHSDLCWSSTPVFWGGKWMQLSNDFLFTQLPSFMCLNFYMLMSLPVYRVLPSNYRNAFLFSFLNQWVFQSLLKLFFCFVLTLLRC